ncbi:hypothetical protein KKF63_07900 [bacterium]|nr:hypothetical protein [bacterium]
MTFIGGMGATVNLNNLPVVGSFMQHYGDTAMRHLLPEVSIREADKHLDFNTQLERYHKDVYLAQKKVNLVSVVGKYMIAGFVGAGVAVPLVVSNSVLSKVPLVGTGIIAGAYLGVGLGLVLAPNLIDAAKAEGNIQALLAGAVRVPGLKEDRLKILAALGYHGVSHTRDVESDTPFDRGMLKQSKLETTLFDFLSKATSKTPVEQINNALDLLVNHFESAYTLYHLYSTLNTRSQTDPDLKSLVAKAFYDVLRAKPHKYYNFISRQRKEMSLFDTTLGRKKNVLYAMMHDLKGKDHSAFLAFCDISEFMAKNKNEESLQGGFQTFVELARKKGSAEEIMSLCQERLEAFAKMPIEDVTLLPVSDWMRLLIHFGEAGEEKLLDFLKGHINHESDIKSVSGYFETVYVYHLLDEKHNLHGFQFQVPMSGEQADKIIKAGGKIYHVKITKTGEGKDLRFEDIETYKTLLLQSESSGTRIYAASRLAELKDNEQARVALEYSLYNVGTYEQVNEAVRIAYTALCEEMFPRSIRTLSGRLSISEEIDRFIITAIAEQAMDHWDLKPLRNAIEYYALAVRPPKEEHQSNPLQTLAWAEFSSEKQAKAMMGIFKKIILETDRLGVSTRLVERRLEASLILMRAWYDAIDDADRFIVINDVVMLIFEQLVQNFKEPELRISGDWAVFNGMLGFLSDSGLRINWESNSKLTHLVKTIVAEERIPVALRSMAMRLVQANPHHEFRSLLRRVQLAEERRVGDMKEVSWDFIKTEYERKSFQKLFKNHEAFLAEVNTAIDSCENV